MQDNSSTYICKNWTVRKKRWQKNGDSRDEILKSIA